MVVEECWAPVQKDVSPHSALIHDRQLNFPKFQMVAGFDAPGANRRTGVGHHALIQARSAIGKPGQDNACYAIDDHRFIAGHFLNAVGSVGHYGPQNVQSV